MHSSKITMIDVNQSSSLVFDLCTLNRNLLLLHFVQGAAQRRHWHTAAAVIAGTTRAHEKLIEKMMSFHTSAASIAKKRSSE